MYKKSKIKTSNGGELKNNYNFGIVKLHFCALRKECD